MAGTTRPVDIGIAFDIERADERYELVAPIESAARRAGDLLIRRKPAPGGGRLSRLPLTNDRVFVTFANIRPDDTRAMVGFTNLYGPLLPDGNQHDGGRNLVSLFRVYAKRLRDDIERHRDDPAGYAASVGTFGPIAHLEYGLSRVELSDRLTVALKARTLLDALRAQFGRDVAAGLVFRACKHCGDIFAAGPGASRQAHAEYCSREHKTKAVSLARSSKPKPKRKS